MSNVNADVANATSVKIHESAENKHVLHIEPNYCLQEKKSHLS